MSLTKGPECNPSQFEDWHEKSQEEIVLSYIYTFLGYGCLKSSFWFFGMEEGGGNDRYQVERRFKHWNVKRNPTEDLVEFQKAIGITKWFALQPRLQSTWKRLIRIYLHAHRKDVTQEAIRDFQRKRLGRRWVEPSSPSPCLFELMPLPSPGLDECPCLWLAQYPQLKFLNNRDDYIEHVLPVREELARKHIQTFKPKVVCFYGLGYLPYWEKIAGTKLQEMRDGDWHFYHVHQNGTLFIASLHPTAFRLRNSYFDTIGKFIAEEL